MLVHRQNLEVRKTKVWQLQHYLTLYVFAMYINVTPNCFTKLLYRELKKVEKRCCKTTQEIQKQMLQNVSRIKSNEARN
jgi:hypothetical protein